MATFNKYDPVPLNIIQPAKTWVEEEGAKVHQALATQSRFVYDRAEFIQRQPHLDLSEAINRYKLVAGKEALIDFNAKEQWTWGDVLQEAEEALKLYNAAGQGAKGAIRKLFRRLGDNEAMISPWLAFIPQDKYMSMFNAGLTLIFTAAKQMAEKRAQIIEALQDMPETLERASQMRKTFRSDQRLAQLATELHYSLLDAIDCMIRWLLEKSRKKHPKAFFQGSQASAVVDEHLQSVGKRVTALQNRIEVLHVECTAKTGAAVQRLEPQLNYIRQIGTANNVQTREILDAVGNAEKIMNDLRQSQAAGLDSQNGMFKTLTDQMLKAQWVLERQNSTLVKQGATIEHLTVEVAAFKERERGQQLECYATTPQLLELLTVDFSTAAKDLQYALGQGQVAKTIPQINFLFQTPRFQYWLQGRMSNFVFVDGNIETYALDKVSPFTVLCAMLSLNVHTMPEAMSIHFYCGLHTGSHDSVSGPRGLLRSLIAQLLLAYEDFDLRFIHSPQYYSELAQHDIGRLCDTFRHLIRQLPADKVVFCLIDGVAFFDSWKLQEELSFVIHKLGALANHTFPDQPIFKLLMISARCTRRLRDLVPPHAYVELGENVHFGENIMTEREVGAHILRPKPSTGAISNRSINVDDDDSMPEEDQDSDIDDYERWPVDR